MSCILSGDLSGDLSSCVICDESFNKSNRFRVECPYCASIACRTCYSEYLLANSEPLCMFPECKRPFTRKFCSEAFTQKFMKNNYRTLRENTLFQHEQSLLPATQIIVEEYNRLSKLLNQSILIYQGYILILSAQHIQLKQDIHLHNEKISIFNDQLVHLGLNKTNRNNRLLDDEDEDEDNPLVFTENGVYIRRNEILQSRLKFLVRKMDRIIYRIHIYNRHLAKFTVRINHLLDIVSSGRTRNILDPTKYLSTDNDDEQNALSSVSRKHVFVRACPNNDCRGFLSSRWKCGLCEQYTCSSCHLIKGLNELSENHICNADDVATAELLKKDSKPCPKCASVIFKISGCDQMWCTVCNTAFSWNTGALIVRGIVHNPHYFEWMRLNNQGGVADRNPMEIRCGRQLDWNFTRHLQTIHQHHNIPDEQSTFANCIIRAVNSISDFMQRNPNNATENNLRLRFEYLTNITSMLKFKKLVQCANKRFQHKLELRDILTTFVQTSTDIMHDYSDILDSQELLLEVVLQKSTEKLNEMRRFVSYINNECLPELKSIYNTTTLYSIIVPIGDNMYDEVFVNLNAKPKK